MIRLEVHIGEKLNSQTLFKRTSLGRLFRVYKHVLFIFQPIRFQITLDVGCGSFTIQKI